ncbi:MAG: V-type ATPase 116kDa subunit family protein [Candidatus Omnitrophota bacterium]
MIVPMEKVTVLMYHKTKDKFLSALQEFGMVHVEIQTSELSEQRLKDIRNRIDRCQTFLKHVKESFPSQIFTRIVEFDEQVFSVVESAEKVQQEIDQADAVLERVEAQIRNLIPWGDFDFDRLNALREVGVEAHFYIAPIRKFETIKLDQYIHAEISRDKVYVYFVVFEKGSQEDPNHLHEPCVSLADCDEFIYPAMDKRKLEHQRLHMETVLRDKKASLKHLSERAGEVESYRQFLISRYAFLNVRDHLQSAAEESVFILTGWIPQEKKKETGEFLDKESGYYFFEKPKHEEKAPILLKNGKFAKLFEPITKMFDLPSYYEMDLTVFLAPFFTLFFGLCCGDSGYGLVIFLGATIARLKFKDKKDMLLLLQILGGSTFFCGLLTGTVFGFDLTKNAALKHYVLLDQNALFYTALILGVIQVIFGMVLKAVKLMRRDGWVSGLSTIGWIVMIFGFLGMSVFKPAVYAVYCGLFLILFFNDMKVNVFLRFGKGLWELYGVTGVFGDVLSYIRLFALGISSAILGFVVNESASQMLSIPYVGFIIAAVFFIAFHAMNLALSCLSSFVHPLRLTFVEFYKNAGFEGGGKAFKPFAKCK